MQNSQINPYRITAAKQVQLTSTIVEWKYHLLFEGRNRGGAIWSHKGCCQFSAADVEWYFLNRLSSTVTNQRSDLHAEVSTILISIVFVHYVGKIVALPCQLWHATASLRRMLFYVQEYVIPYSYLLSTVAIALLFIHESATIHKQYNA